MPLILASQVNSLAFIAPLDPASILDEFIVTAETKFIIPVITQPVYDDLEANYGLYSKLITAFIQPYLAYCVKLLIFNQYITESEIYTIPKDQRRDVIQEISVLANARKTMLVKHLSLGDYPLYIPPSKKRITGFLIN